MPKSSPHRSLGRRPHGTITVLTDRVHRSSARNARLAFFLTLVVVGLLTATVAADRMHPILALLLGFAVGSLSGTVVWTVVRIWPVIRLLWWWTPEILLVVGVVYGWTALAAHTSSMVTLVVAASVVGIPAGIPVIRRRLVALAWCVIVRHRLRVCFAEFIIANQSGTLPLILWARPTPVGERVWIYLRPGLALSDLNTETRLDKIAVACHASAVTIERAADTTAAYLRVDVKRREVLTGTIASPLVDLVDPATPTVPRPAIELPTALDLPDVAADPAPALAARGENRRTPATVPAGPPASANGSSHDDTTDWI